MDSSVSLYVTLEPIRSTLEPIRSELLRGAPRSRGATIRVARMDASGRTEKTARAATKAIDTPTVPARARKAEVIASSG